MSVQEFYFENHALTDENKEEINVIFNPTYGLQNEVPDQDNLGYKYINKPFLIKDIIDNENVGLTYEAAKFVYESLKEVFKDKE